MIPPALRRGASLAWPEGLVLALGLFAYSRWHAVGPSIAPSLTVAPYLVFGAGILLSWRFHRARLLFAVLVLAVADRVLAVGLPDPDAAPARVLSHGIALLVPLDLLAFALLDRRGALARPGMVRVGFVLAQAAILAALYRWAPEAAARALGLDVFPWRLTAWTPVADPALTAFAAVFVAFVLRAATGPDATRRGFLWTLVAAFLAMHTVPRDPLPTLFFVTGGLVVLVAAIESSHFMAFRDELTGLPARRAFSDALARLTGRYTVAMVDVDRFKRVNDRHGHDVGDQVLRMVAAKLERISGGGRAFRYGGEEFALIFPGKRVEAAQPHLERLREAVEKSKFTVRRLGGGRKRGKSGGRRSRKLSITISIGAAEGTDDEPGQDAVVEAADEALYRAKRAGRNRVRI